MIINSNCNIIIVTDTDESMFDHWFGYLSLQVHDHNQIVQSHLKHCKIIHHWFVWLSGVGEETVSKHDHKFSKHPLYEDFFYAKMIPLKQGF